VDEWVQELCIAQEAWKLILANIKSEQKDWVESMPYQLRTWEAGNQVMLQADCKGKGQSKELSKKKWMGPHPIVEVWGPQVVVVLKEPNSWNNTPFFILPTKPRSGRNPLAALDTAHQTYYTGLTFLQHPHTPHWIPTNPSCNCQQGILFPLRVLMWPWVGD